MTSGTRSTNTTTEQKRRDYRVKTQLELRFRPVVRASEEATGPDTVALFEELSLAQTRFRKELGPAGRSFVDKLMATVDALTGLAAAGGHGAGTGWGTAFLVDSDLSAGGIGFVTSESMEKGSEVEVQFSLPEAGSTVPFRCFAEVVRCDPAGDGSFACGIAFSEVSGTTQRRLIRVVLELQRVQLRNQGGTG